MRYHSKCHFLPYTFRILFIIEQYVAQKDTWLLNTSVILDSWEMNPEVSTPRPQLQQGDHTARGRGLELLKAWGSPLRSSTLERRRGKQSSASQWSLWPEQAPVCSVVCKLPVRGAPCGEAAGEAVLRAYRGPRLEDYLRTLYSVWEDLTKCSAYQDPRGLEPSPRVTVFSITM